MTMDNVPARELLAALEQIEAAEAALADAKKIAKSRAEALKAVRTAIQGAGYNLQIVDILLVDRRRPAGQMELVLEEERAFRTELAVYRDALAELPEGIKSADIPFEPTPIEAAIDAATARGRANLHVVTDEDPAARLDDDRFGDEGDGDAEG